MSFNLKKKYLIYSFLSLFLLFLSFIFLPKSVLAEDPDPKINHPEYKARYVSQSTPDPVEIEAGGTKVVTVNFKNIGSATWSPNASNYISAYTMNPRYHDSDFSNGQWISENQTAKIQEVVEPGETGSLKIKLKAPSKVGEYKQEFYLASENHTWVDGGYFYLDIKVTEPTSVPQAESEVNDPQPTIHDSGFQAQYLSQSIKEPVNIKPGETKKISVNFKNNGDKAWNPGASNFVSAYTMKPRYRDSDFSGDGWISSRQTAKIDSLVQPGENGELTIPLHAPNKTGEYTEQFYLASENHSWVKGGYFYVDINVTNNFDQPSNQQQKDEKNKDSKKNLSDYKGAVIFINKQKIESEGGDRVKIILAAKNETNKPLSDYSIKLISENKFADQSWVNKKTIVSRKTSVAHNSVFREDFFMRAPPEEGKYDLKLAVFTDGKRISGTEFEIPVTVNEDAAESYVPAFANEDEETKSTSYRYKEEPNIRVGLKKIENNYTLFIPKNDDYKVLEGGDVLKGTVEEGETATLRRKNGEYYFSNGDIKFSSPDYIRLEPTSDKDAVFELAHFERNVPWREKNFDTYHGGFEYRLTESGEDLYAINDVPLEEYVKGIGETSENPPMDMQRAQAVVSRTYAEYTKKTTKHNERNFDVVGSTGDQLYLGVKSEDLSPNYVEATENTRGYMVTYDDDLVITPYFGHSNGYTRSWEQVWGGEEKPWLVPVRTEYDEGLATYGHGVGMSQRDAAIRADKENIDWKDLLKHYYTDIELEKFYK